jgi:YHS domain-containing protein
MAQDPVCKMEVDEKKAAGKSEYEGQVYFFCSANCKRWFDKYPERYVVKKLPDSENNRQS